MRKDLKIGMAIGAVLLVVLIVYLAVPKGDEQIAQNSGGGNDTAATDGAGAIRSYSLLRVITAVIAAV